MKNTSCQKKSTKDIIQFTYIFQSFQMNQNPWNVDSIEAFTFLKCPECNFDTQGGDNFRDHAVENHPLSFVFFQKQLKEEPLDIKEECWELEDINRKDQPENELENHDYRYTIENIYVPHITLHCARGKTQKVFKSFKKSHRPS